MARDTVNLLRAEVELKPPLIVSMLRRNIEGITQSEVCNVILHIEDYVAGIKDDKEREKWADRHELPPVDFDNAVLEDAKKIVRNAWDKIELPDKFPTNDRAAQELIKSLPYIGNDELVDLLTLRPNNLRCIEDDNRRSMIAKRHGYSSVPSADVAKGGRRQRLMEQIRKVRTAQKHLLDRIEALNMDHADDDLTFYHEIDEKTFDRMTLIGDWEQINHLYGEDANGIGIPLGIVSVKAGDAGVGKTRFEAALAGHLSRRKENGGLGVGVLYVGGEMEPEQFKAMTSRRIDNNAFFVTSRARTMTKIENHIRQAAMSFKDHKTVLRYVIIDSKDMVFEARTASGLQLVIEKFKTIAKDMDIHITMIGHLNKQGTIKGSNIFNYMVDQVFYLRNQLGDGAFSISIPDKNRCGRTGVSVEMQHHTDGVSVVKQDRGGHRRLGTARFDSTNRTGGRNRDIAALGNQPVIDSLRNANESRRSAERGADTRTIVRSIEETTGEDSE